MRWPGSYPRSSAFIRGPKCFFPYPAVGTIVPTGIYNSQCFSNIRFDFGKTLPTASTSVANIERLAGIKRRDRMPERDARLSRNGGQFRDRISASQRDLAVRDSDRRKER